jgi:hypothetical protein
MLRKQMQRIEEGPSFFTCFENPLYENCVPLENEVLPPPKNILLIGSSSMRGDLGLALEKILKKEAELNVHRHAKIGTGLARPDFYDWFTISTKLAEEHQSELVIAQFIGNDCQALINADRSIEARRRDSHWAESYKSRAMTFIEDLQKDGAEVVMIGMPIVENRGFRNRIQNANSLVKEAAEETGAHFISIWDLSTSPNGAYKTEIKSNGRIRKFRHPDGIHLSRAGASFIAKGIYEKLEGLYGWDIDAAASL